MAPGDRRASVALLDNREATDKATEEKAPTQQKLDTLQAHVAEVMRGWRVREKPFRSTTPVVGKAVVRLRERLNNLSTRWYVQPILQQQVDYNASVARTLREISGQLAELQARVGLQALLTAGLSARQQQAPMDEIRSELETLRARIGQLEAETALRGEGVKEAR